MSNVVHMFRMPDSESVQPDSLDIQQLHAHSSEMITREELDAKFETVKVAVDGLRHSQNIVLAVLALSAAVTMGAFGYTYSRIDRLEDKIDALPGELRGIADSITGAITATKQQPPIVIMTPPQNGAAGEPRN